MNASYFLCECQFLSVILFYAFYTGLSFFLLKLLIGWNDESIRCVKSPYELHFLGINIV
jgi:hypothetical protein